MGKVISVINYKGGVGKTTITLQLGIGLATLFKKKVLMIDLDPQCSLSLSTVDEHYWADWLERKGSIVQLASSFYNDKKAQINPEWIIQNALDRSWDNEPGSTPNLDLLPSHLDLPDYEMQLMNIRPKIFFKRTRSRYIRRFLILREALVELRKHYDYILFDCAPNIYLISRNAILASDYYLVPTIPDFISCYGIPFILEHIRKMQSDMKEIDIETGAHFLGILRNRVKHSGGNLVREHEDHSQQLKEEYGNYLLSEMIMDRIGIAELLSSRANIQQSQSAKTANIRTDFAELTKAIIKRTR